jgi:hypothetical protein
MAQLRIRVGESYTPVVGGLLSGVEMMFRIDRRQALERCRRHSGLLEIPARMDST